MIAKQQGSILLLTLLVLAVLLSVIAGMEVATNRRLHLASEQSTLQEINGDQQSGMLWALEALLSPNDQWPLIQHLNHGDRESVIWVEPLQGRLNVNVWLQPGALSEKMSQAWPFQNVQSTSKALADAVLAKRHALGLANWSTQSTQLVQSIQWIDWRASPELSRSEWLSLGRAVVAYPQKESTMILDPRLLHSAMLRILGASDIHIQQWKNCLSKSPKSLSAATTCASEVHVLAAQAPHWQANTLFVITVVTVAGKIHRTMQTAVRLTHKGKTWHWAVLWQHEGLALSMGREGAW